MPFDVMLPDSVKEQLSHFPLDVRKRIANGIKTLQEFPFPHGNTVRRIQGTKKPLYRLRIGDYRAVYHLDVERKMHNPILFFRSIKG
jgi:mRNA-degrading endonuclease RelE of RelBE toxin-antitoxin system